MKYPNLFIVGLPKAGTTSLHNMLIQHSAIHGNSDYKDYMFFNKEERIKDLVHLSKGYQGEKYILDGGATYAFHQHALARIRAVVPDAKLIFIVRNPVSRTLSDFYFRRKYGRIELTEEEVLHSIDKVKALGMIHRLSLFGQQFERIYHHFSKEQVKIILFEKLLGNKEEVIQDLFEFLNISNESITLSHKNKTGNSRIPAVTRLIRGRSNLKSIVSKLIPKYIRQRLARAIVDVNTTNQKKERKLEGLRLEMLDWYTEDLKLASTLTGIDFISLYTENEKREGA